MKMTKALPLLFWICIGYTFRPQIDSIIHPIEVATHVAEEVRVEEATPTPSPTPSPTVAPTATPEPQTDLSALTEEVVHFIWTIESGKGTAKFGWAVECRKIGKWNEIGYGGSDFCFDSEAEGLATLRSTIRTRLEKQGLIETLCVYNLGYLRDESGKRIKYTDCTYYQKFKSL